MIDYGQFCTVARGAEVLGELWTPLVVRELLCGSHRFNDIKRGVPRMSATLLTQQLRKLEQMGVIERRRAKGVLEYHLTAAGEELRPIVVAIGHWGARWDVNNTGVDPALSGYTGIEVDIGANPQTAVQVATALQAAVDALGDFVATVSGYTVRITDAAVGYAIPAHDAQATASKTGFAFNMITVGDEYEKLGMIDGDVEISGLSRSPVDITSHQSGTDIIGQIFSGSGNPEMSFALKEFVYAKLEKIKRYGSGVYLPVGGSNTLVGIGSKGQ